MRGENISYWVASASGAEYPALDRDLTVDSVVIGGGIVGMTAAVLLQHEGLQVAILEMDRVGRGVTGYTTAKVTSGHNLIYSQLEAKHGTDTARAYAEANEAGLELIRNLVQEHAIECDLEPKANFVYVESAAEADRIDAEIEAARRAGLSVERVEDCDLPYPIAAGIRLDGQAQFHPKKYLNRLAEVFVAHGGSIFEKTRALGVDEGEPSVVQTEGGSVSARDVVVASHYPFVDRALLFPRVHPKRSYAIAGHVEESVLPDGMYISADQPTRSVRTIPNGDRRLLMIGGEGHAVGQNHSTDACYANLESWAEERFGMSEVAYRWSTQDGTSIDLIPFIGAYRPSHRVYVATAFGKWGFTNGTIGARVIADQIAGRSNPYEDLFNPRRITPKASLPTFLQENAKVGAHWFGDRAVHPNRGSIEDLAPGEAAVSGVGLDQVAAFRDDNGELHKVSAVCTHLRCIVAWNEAERTWDCPCHGSRFAIDGTVIHGPATKDLRRID